MNTEDARRFDVTDAPAQAPGACFLTKTSVGPFIDTKVDVSPPGRIDRGRVYIAESAVKEMAEIMGLLISKEEKKDAYDMGYNNGYDQGVKENIGDYINRAIADLTELVGQLTSYMVPAGSEASEDTGPVLKADEPAGESVPSKPAGVSKSKSRSGQVSRKGTGTGGSKRPNRLPADTGDGANQRI